MSFVRLLSTAKGSPRPQSPSSATQSYKPTLSLHVPGYGAIIAALSEPNPLDLSADLEPKYDLDLRGELEIRMPHGSGRMRCKSIRVGMRSMLKIAIKGKRKEEHELSDCRVEIIGGTSEGVWLEEGAQRFEFTLLLPPKLAPQNWVPGANISHDLYAELEGVPEPTTTSPFFRTLSLSSFSSGKTPTSSRLPSRSPSPTGSPSLSNAALGSTSMSITRQEGAYIPQAPSYDESQAVYTGKSLQSGSTEDDRWITGTHDTHRTVMIVFNPHPTGQVNSLDEQVTGFTEGVGVYKWRMSADQWHIAAWPLFRFLLPDPASTVTLFAFRYSLNQTVMITSPSDPDNPHTVTTNFPFVERGKIPHRDHGNPSPALPALWRGKDAKGSDEGEFKIEAKGQMPKDDVLRPSTIPGCARSTWTPIHIAHTLVAEVFFSIWGKNEFGEDMPRPGPGGLQVMRIKRPVVVPSCALIPQILDLPTYRPAAHLNGGSDRDACKCKLCGLRPHEIVCQQCPPTVIPHLRHDLDPTLTGNKSGVCPACAAKRLVPDGEPDWKTCACGMAVDDMEERMKAFLQEMDAEGEADRRRTGTEMKEEAERGRRFSRN